MEVMTCTMRRGEGFHIYTNVSSRAYETRISFTIWIPCLFQSCSDVFVKKNSDVIITLFCSPKRETAKKHDVEGFYDYTSVSNRASNARMFSLRGYHIYSTADQMYLLKKWYRHHRYLFNKERKPRKNK